MSFAPTEYYLLAQISRWERLGDGLHRPRGRIEFADFAPYIILTILLGGVIAAVLTYRKHNDWTVPCDDPRKLFRELSRAHRLDRHSRRLLRQLAEVLQLEQPAEVFLQPAYFKAENLPAPLQSEAAWYEQLRERLF